jgi:hypothetical protein
MEMITKVNVKLPNDHALTQRLPCAQTAWLIPLLAAQGLRRLLAEPAAMVLCKVAEMASGTTFRMVVMLAGPEPEFENHPD